MKNNSKVILISLMMVLISTLALTGCENKSTIEECDYDASKVNNMSIVIDNTLYSQKDDITPYKNLIKAVCLNEGTINIIVSDGEPYVAKTITIPKQKEGLSRKKLEKNAEQYTEEICSYVTMLEPKTPESDPLKAINLAARMLNNEETTDNNKILIYSGTGIGTKGMINFNSILLSNDVDVITHKLQQEDTVPQLNGVGIYCIGVGEPVGKQVRPSEKEYRFIKALYKQIFNISGANKIEFAAIGENTTDGVDGLPYVTPVVFSDTTTISEEEIGFKVNTAEFLDEKSAMQQLEKIAQYYDNKRLLIIGLASSEGGDSTNQRLSEKRAAKVGQIMSQFGEFVEVKTLGLGFDKRFCERDTDLKGNLIESVAHRNRKIIIMDKDSSAAKEIVTKG